MREALLFAALAGAALVGCVSETHEHGPTQRGADKSNWWDALPRASWSRFERVASGQPWFEVYRVRESIFAIYEPGHFEEVISYLILGSERAVLFDTGLGIGDIESLASELTDLPVMVINSHSHYDHIGGNHAFEEVLGAQTDYSDARQAGLAHEAVAAFVADGWLAPPVPVWFDTAAYRIHPFRRSGSLIDGQTVSLGDRELHVVITPGHSPDSLCLYDPTQRVLFTGDTFYPAPLYTHVDGSDFDAYRASAKRLAALAPGIDRLMPGHNETDLSPEYLARMHAAFEQIAAGEGVFEVTDGVREYPFEGFSILTRQP